MAQMITRILAIAPYDGMKLQMQRIAEEYLGLLRLLPHPRMGMGVFLLL